MKYERGDRRVTIRKSLHPLYLPYYDAICAELPSDWEPYFGRRSFERQRSLFEMGRTKSGKIVTYADAGESPHNYGCASDWCPFDENDKPYWPEINDPKWKEYEYACVKSGADWGGLFVKIVDYPHNQLPLKTAWKNVKKEYDSGGIEKAMDFIKQNL